MHPPGGAYGPYAVVVIHLRASLVILLGVNSNCPNSGECIALQQGLKNKQMFAIINEARKYKYIRFSNLSIYLIYCNYGKSNINRLIERVILYEHMAKVKENSSNYTM